MQFENVTAVCKANIYFDGKVVSHTVLFGDGSKKTLGLIYPGNYNFSTGTAEKMEITSGECRVKLSGETSWRTFSAGTFFRVPAKSSFDIAVDNGIAEYVCSYE
jgi:uncharacterized protein YaiE (UPF0345 family)